uniref:Branchpoint-bridging protein n=1 Tax=Meloidogyne javanica TaxID=6303 RepID=A0A915MQZ0_MELJA
MRVFSKIFLDASLFLSIMGWADSQKSPQSPSPEPVYDITGKRLNTREIRKRQELELRRHEKIQAILRLNPNYKPPTDYRPPTIKLHDKVWIPQEEHPEINFVGLLIGPRGNTLKALEAE